jgi:hypothetical protein
LAFDPKSPEKADYRAMRATLSRVRARYRKNPYFNFILEFKAAYDSAGVVMEKIEAVKKILRQLEVAKERLAGAKASLAETKENEKRTIFPGSDTDDEAKIRILVGQLEAGNKNLRALDIFFAEQLPPS